MAVPQHILTKSLGLVWLASQFAVPPDLPLTPYCLTLGRCLPLCAHSLEHSLGFLKERGDLVGRGQDQVPERGAHRRWERRVNTANSSRMSTRMRESVRMSGSRSGEPGVIGQSSGLAPSSAPTPPTPLPGASPLAVSSDAGSDQALQKPSKLGSAIRARTLKV